MGAQFSQCGDCQNGVPEGLTGAPPRPRPPEPEVQLSHAGGIGAIAPIAPRHDCNHRNGNTLTPIPIASLLYIDREGKKKNSTSEAKSVSASTVEGGPANEARSSRSAGSTAGMVAKGMIVLQATGMGISGIPAAKLDKDKLASFREALHMQGVDTTKWGVNGTKSVEHLYWETYQQRGCYIAGLHELGAAKRVTRIVKVRIVAEIFGVDHTLYSRLQFMHNGQANERRQVPLARLVWSDLWDEDPDIATLSSEVCPYVEDWRAGFRRALELRLGLTEKWQQMHLEEDTHAYSYHTEDNGPSLGYPGLNTLYCIHNVAFRIVQPEHVGVQCIGLPHGHEFATTEGDFNLNMQNIEEGLAIGTQLNIWTWRRDEPTVQPKLEPNSPTSPGHPKIDTGESHQQQLRLIKRVPLPAMSSQALAEMRSRIARQSTRAPSAALWSAMEGQVTDWGKVRQMARTIADPNYTLSQFSKDLMAFPELNLYLLDKVTRTGSQAAQMSSGRTLGDEYQRTIGAFFAIYWLMRLQGDGKDGFSFGVDENWVPIVADSSNEERLFPADKRLAFREQGRWGDFHKLLVTAGLLEKNDDDELVISEQRLVSLLALTAIHDIMKMDIILPHVQGAHAPFHGYRQGDIIGDHDHALSYVMGFYPALLPSFRGLNANERLSVQFTQCNLQFNHGWFVQAEAPPGAIFTKFREAVSQGDPDEEGEFSIKHSERDISLYFVHWLTDLAGAEPTPLGGCEKFVVKFPLAVLNSFLRSFEFVWQIGKKTETQVMEEYLQTRWQEHSPSPGPLPHGASAVAKMRLLCMAQMNAAPVLAGFDELADEDREVLSNEMARTGCKGQSYSDNLAPVGVRLNPMGPAFLIYYGPAFLQNLGNDKAVSKLSILAEIYRCARSLWPADSTRVTSNVTIRVDTIKTLSSAAIREVMANGDMWILVKHNNTEAFIEQSSKRKLNQFIMNQQSVQVLDLSNMQQGQE